LIYGSKNSVTIPTYVDISFRVFVKMWCGKCGMRDKMMHSIKKKDKIYHNITYLTNLDLSIYIFLRTTENLCNYS
jgi:hypothetical protein